MVYFECSKYKNNHSTNLLSCACINLFIPIFIYIYLYLFCNIFIVSLVLIRKVEENISLFLFFTSWASIDLVPSIEFLFLKSSISKNNHKSIFPDQIKSPSVFSAAIKAAIRRSLAQLGESIDHGDRQRQENIFLIQGFSLISNPDILWENVKIRECHNKLFDCSCRHSIM